MTAPWFAGPSGYPDPGPLAATETREMRDHEARCAAVIIERTALRGALDAIRAAAEALAMRAREAAADVRGIDRDTAEALDFFADEIEHDAGGLADADAALARAIRALEAGDV